MKHTLRTEDMTFGSEKTAWIEVDGEHVNRSTRSIELDGEEVGTCVLDFRVIGEGGNRTVQGSMKMTFLEEN